MPIRRQPPVVVEQSFHGCTGGQRDFFLLALKDVPENAEIKHAYLHQEQNTLRVRRRQRGFAGIFRVRMCPRPEILTAHYRKLSVARGTSCYHHVRMNTKTFFLTLGSLAFILTLSLGAPAQTTAKTPAKPPVHHPAASSTGIKLPANIPPATGVLKTAYSLRYIDIKVGTGALAAPGMLYFVHYTGWLYDGTKFDSSVDRGTPIQFVQGQRRLIPGWDTGFEGMHVGGKRRLFIPYQLAYGDQAKGPIPPRSNLIFDVELVNMTAPNSAPPPTPPSQ